MAIKLNKSITKLHKDLTHLRTDAFTLEKFAEKKISRDKYNCYECLTFNRADNAVRKIKHIEEDELLKGIPYVIKDNYSTKGFPTCASSESLNGYVPLYDAEIVRRLDKKGAIMVAKTSMDELAMGGTGTTSHLGVTKNPLDTTRIIGGSSSGSAASLLAGHCTFAIGSDTGDSVRKPASYAGLVGFKPTYGLISRYGLFGFAQSMDTVAYFTTNVLDSAILTDALAGYDKKDASSYAGKYDKNFIKYAKVGVKNKKLCYFEDLIEAIENKEVVEKFYKLVETLKSNGFTVEGVKFGTTLLNAIYPTYMILSCAEASSNDACLDGIKYGPSGDAEEFENYREMMKNNRTKGFCEMIKRRFVVGSFSLLSDNRYEIFDRAQKARGAIVRRMNEIYSQYDALILPASGHVAPKIEDVSYSWSTTPDFVENHMAIGNFGGFPSITIPWMKEDATKLPIGVNITSPIFTDAMLLGIASSIEKLVKED